MIHEIDPHHLTTTMLAGIGPELVDEIRARAPDLDLLSIQMYADIENLPQRLEDAGWDGPYMVTEWGATGHWEVPKTPWGAPIENTSSVKADLYRSRYQTAIASDTTQRPGLLRLPLGPEAGAHPDVVRDVLADGRGDGVGRRDGVAVDGRDAGQPDAPPRLGHARRPRRDGRDHPGARAARPGAGRHDRPGRGPAPLRLGGPQGSDGPRARAATTSPCPTSSPTPSIRQRPPRSLVTAPTASGAYRLFVYVYDGQGHAAHANIPFYVGDY